eukprot:6583498-Pyramimonas_sp.AAC.1
MKSALRAEPVHRVDIFTNCQVDVIVVAARRADGHHAWQPLLRSRDEGFVIERLDEPGSSPPSKLHLIRIKSPTCAMPP